jgi:hypothetical protein
VTLGLSEEYINELKKETTYSPIWFPNRSISIGDVGRIRNYNYEHLTTLKEMGIESEGKEGKVQADFQYCSSGAVTIKADLDAKKKDIITEAETGLSIFFSRKNAIFFRISGCKSCILNNAMEVGNKVVDLYQRGKWEKNMVVVSEVISATSSTIIVSRGNNSEIKLLANGNINAAKIDLADLSLKLRVLSEKNIAAQIVAQQGLTPLFKASGLKKNILNHATWEEKRFNAKEANDPKKVLPEAISKEIIFGQVEYEDFS